MTRYIKVALIDYVKETSVCTSAFGWSAPIGVFFTRLVTRLSPTPLATESLVSRSAHLIRV